MAIRYALIPADGVALPPTSQMSGIGVNNSIGGDGITTNVQTGKCGAKATSVDPETGQGLTWGQDSNYLSKNFEVKAMVLVGKLSPAYDRKHTMQIRVNASTCSASGLECPVSNGDAFKYWQGMDIEGNDKDVLTMIDTCEEEGLRYWKVKFAEETPE